MHFLPDVYVQCDVCKGKRYNRETLEIAFKDKSIADILDLTVDEGVEFFKAVPPTATNWETFKKVGSATFTAAHPAPPRPAAKPRPGNFRRDCRGRARAPRPTIHTGRTPAPT